MKKLLVLVSLGLLIGCKTERSEIDGQVSEFVALYEERTDFEGFLNLYAEDMILEDMVGGYLIKGKAQFAEFFNWSDERFKKTDAPTIVVNHRIVNQRKAVLQGYFTPFSWDGQKVESMQFTTILFFDDQGKIEKHVDWINYPIYLIDYSKRTNSNDWLN